MEKFHELYEEYRDYILFFLCLVLVIISEAFLYINLSNNITKISLNSKEEKKEVVKDDISYYAVEIKGEVKKPGVYSIEKGKRVIDVVKKAGGLTKKANTKANNLSLKVKDEMVITIYNDEEIMDYEKTKEEEKIINEKCNSDIVRNDSCTDIESDFSSNDNNNENKLISINTASKEELMTISGIGESKAIAIIKYREENKFEKIEDIKNVSGIGDALYEKIKDFITT